MYKRAAKYWLAVSLSVLWLGTFSGWARTQESDAQLRASGEEKLFHTKLADKVSITVENAAATLTGVVNSIGFKELAGKEVSKVHGITRIDNRIQVTPAPGGDNEVQNQVRRKVWSYPYYSIFDNVELGVENGRVVLSGQVTQPWKKDAIAWIASFVPGVRELQDNIEVLPVSIYDDQIRIRVARALYRDLTLTNLLFQPNPAIHIVVKNGDVTLTGVVDSQVQKAKAANDARFAATFFKLDNEIRIS